MELGLGLREDRLDPLNPFPGLTQKPHVVSLESVLCPHNTVRTPYSPACSLGWSRVGFYPLGHPTALPAGAECKLGDI